MINFNSLPTDKPSNNPKSGTYYATIVEAEIKNSKDPTKAPYLSTTIQLKNAKGENAGKVFDNIVESDKPLMQYKLSRFLKALGLTNLTTFELADLVKIVKNKQFIVDIKEEEAKDGYPAKSVVDVLTGSIYYPMSDAADIFGDVAKTTIEVIDDELKIDESDAEDVHATDDDF